MEIIADSGIVEKVAADVWTEIVGAFTDPVKGGPAANGFVRAVEACGALLASCVPRPHDDRDEVPNNLIEI